MQHQGYERIARDDYLDDLAARPLDEVRAMRAECQAVEADLSYLRRLVQGRLDIAVAEVRRRESGDPAPDPDALVASLAHTLAEHAPGTGRKAHAGAMGPATPDDSLTAELDDLCDGRRLAELPEMGPVRLLALVDDLTALERDVSTRRGATFQRLDALSAEITRRYRTGEASVDSLLR
jgi:hypothetical protein